MTLDGLHEVNACSTLARCNSSAAALAGIFHQDIVACVKLKPPPRRILASHDVRCWYWNPPRDDCPLLFLEHSVFMAG